MNALTQRLASFKLDGKKIDLIPADMRRSANSYSLKLDHGLAVILDFDLPADGFCRWTVRLKNEGAERTGQITELLGCDLALEVEGVTVFESLTGDTCGQDTFLPMREILSDGGSIEKAPVGGRSSQHTAFPYFDLASDAGSAVFAVGWTGQWHASVSREGNRGFVRIGFEDCDFYLEPGEEARSAGTMVCFASTILEARQKFRRIFREAYSPAVGRGGKLEIPLSLQVFDRYFRKNPDWATEAGQLQCVKCAEKMKLLNTYWLDAAWFREGFPCGVGNYAFEPSFPNGLLPVSKAAHAVGLQFMLWFEPERNYDVSDTARDYPDFMLESGNPNDHNRLFNLAKEDAYRWLRDTLVRMIRDNGVDIYRQDFNMDPLPYWRLADEEGRKGYTENRYITNLYRLWDDLLAEFPGLLIDNCSSGGRRLDYEMNMRSVPMWRSDTGCFPASENAPTHLWNQNQTLGLTRYLPYHATATWTEETNAFRSAATMGLACNLDVMNDAFDAEAALRPLEELVRLRALWGGDFYPLTEASKETDVWAAYQLACVDEGFCAFFRRDNAPESAAFAIQAIDGDAEYEIILTDNAFHKTVKRVRGAALAQFDARIEKGGESLILEYRKL